MFSATKEHLEQITVVQLTCKRPVMD